MGRKIYLCAINNILSGNCNQDCAFCTQSIYNSADIKKYSFKPIGQILQEAKEAVANGATGYCLVTSGLGLNSNKTEKIAKIAYTLNKALPNLNLIACNGLASVEQLKYLKQNGIGSYNHNLETSKEYYKQICTTHSWQERFTTCENIKLVGLNLCCGGIYGMGESLEEQENLIASIASLKPQSTPINFYLPNSALKIDKRTIGYNDALKIIKKLKKALPNVKIMVAGGREAIFDNVSKEMQMYKMGVDSIVIGNYLTVDGKKPQNDIERLKSFGLDIAKDCNA